MSTKAKKGVEKTEEKIDQFSSSWGVDDKDKDYAGRRKKTYKGFKYLKKSMMFFGKYKAQIILGFVVGLIGSVLLMVPAIFTGKLIETFTNFNANLLIRYALYIAIFDVSGYLIYMLFHVIFQRVRRNVARDLREKLLEEFSRLKIKNYDGANTGRFVALVNSDTEQLSSVMSNVISVVTNVSGKVAFLVYAMFVNIWLSLFIVAEFLIIFILENTRIKGWIYRSREAKKVQDKSFGLTNEVILGMRDVRVLNMKKNVLQKSSVIQGDVVKKMYKAEMFNGLFARSNTIVREIFAFAFIVLAVLLIGINEVSIGGALTIYIYRGHISFLTNWIVTIGEFINTGEMHAERIFTILDGYNYGVEEFGDRAVDVSGNVEFKNVSFGYDKKKKVLHDVSFEIEKNKTTAIVGESGSGKSTILNLMNKMYEKDKGDIFFDGIAIDELSEESLRSKMATVLQDPYIFNMSIKENIEFSNPDLTPKQLEEVCKQALLHSFIMKQEKKYDTVLGESGVMLSGGQRQRLAIARALARDSKIILLDEATSALDNENQAKIKQVIEGLEEGKTVVIVAHRLSTIVNADKIIVIKDGRVYSQGTHKQLMRNCDEYKKLYLQEEKEANSL